MYIFHCKQSYFCSCIVLSVGSVSGCFLYPVSWNKILWFFYIQLCSGVLSALVVDRSIAELTIKVVLEVHKYHLVLEHSAGDSQWPPFCSMPVCTTHGTYTVRLCPRVNLGASWINSTVSVTAHKLLGHPWHKWVIQKTSWDPNLELLA